MIKTVGETLNIEVLIDANEKNAFKFRENMLALGGFINEIEGLKINDVEVFNVLSYLDFLKKRCIIS